MADDILSLSGSFPDASEADWLEGVSKALKGGGIERITRETLDGIKIKPLYRESDFASSTDPLGQPGAAPFLRGADRARDAYLPWDIRQRFTHPDPAVTNAEIMRDLERGVSSIELAVECTGAQGCAIHDLPEMQTALAGVKADLATVAIDHRGSGTGTSMAGILALWAETTDEPKAQKLAFNIDPLGALARTGLIEGGLDAGFARAAQLAEVLALRFPLATTLRVDARAVHEAGGSEAQELGALIAHGVDTLRRLEAAGMARDLAAGQIVFTLSASANYGIEIAKLRAARRLWARCLEALDIEPQPMKLQAVTSARMLTRYDPWTNMLRGTAACFAAAIGGSDVITVRPFNEALGMPEELGRRTARNTQIIAMEESHLGKVADPAGGAWFEEALGNDLAEAAWAELQTIEREGGYGASLMADAFQARVATMRTVRLRDIAKRKIPITGVSEYPLLEGIAAPVAEADYRSDQDGVSPDGLNTFLPRSPAAQPGEDAMGEPLWPIRLAEPFERLRDIAEARTAKSGQRPAIFLATLGPIAEHTARADFARNLFATGGIEAKEPPVPPGSVNELVAAYKASGCALAVICGADKRYEAEAGDAAEALKAAGAQRIYLAGKFEAGGIDSHIFMGANVVHTLELAHAELGLTS